MLLWIVQKVALQNSNRATETYNMNSIVPALRAGIIHNDKQWELYHLYL